MSREMLAPGSSVVVAIVGLFMVLLWRVREGRRPVTLRSIVVPPAGMATGFTMFLIPAFRVHASWAAIAFLVGALGLAFPLIRTSRLTMEAGIVLVRRSKVFFLVVLVLALVRFLARSYLGRIISLQQTAGLFFILAFGMILTWRASMLLEYKWLVSSAVGRGARQSSQTQ